MSSRLLLVRHGPGRGRLPGYLDDLLEAVRVRWPAVHARLQLHFTGMPLPSLDGIAAVVFWLADPLRQAYPRCYAEAAWIAAEAAERGILTRNPPDALSTASKSRQAGAWLAAGLPVPPQHRFTTRAELSTAADAAGYPCVIRGDLVHHQENAHFCGSAEDVAQLPSDRLSLPGVAGGFVDTRASFQEAGRADIWATLFHKKRVFVLGDSVRTNHVLFSRHAVVGLESSIWAQGSPIPWHALPGVSPKEWTGESYWRWRRRWRRQDHRLWQQSIEADYAYWRSVEDGADIFVAACRVLGLHFAAIDYATFADGSLVLWEANPYFYLHPRGKAPLSRERRMDERLMSYYEAVEDWLSSLMPDA